MKKYIIILVLVSCAANAQPTQPEPSYSITMTVSEYNLILKQLSELPWKEVNPIISKMISQLNEQSKPAPPATSGK